METAPYEGGFFVSVSMKTFITTDLIIHYFPSNGKAAIISRAHTEKAVIKNAVIPLMPCQINAAIIRLLLTLTLD